MFTQAKLNLQGPDLIEYAISNTPPEELNQTEQLWREIYEPTPREIIHNPAICLSKNSTLKTTIEIDDKNHFIETVWIDGQQYDIDKDLIHWITPGRGNQKHETYATKIIACSDDQEHYARATFRHCSRPSCPSCAHYIITKKTPDQVKKIWTKHKELMRLGDWKNQFIQHVAVSVPPELWPLALTPEGKKKLDKEMREIVKQAGIVGGLYIFHSSRYGDDDDIPPEGWTPEAGRFATFGPHYHIIGFGFIDNKNNSTTQDIEASTGWVVKSIRSSSKADKNPIKGPADVSAIIYYLKTHASLPAEDGAQIPRYKSVVFFGVCGPRAQELVATIDIYTPQICPDCGAPLHKHHVHGANGDTSPEGQLSAKISYPIYAPRQKAEALRGYIQDNTGYIGEILRSLDSNPFLGTAYLSHRQFTGLIAPLSIMCLDKTLHVVEPYATIKANKKKSGKGKIEIGGTSRLGQDYDLEFLSELDGSSEAPGDEDLTPEAIPYIDYYLPPEVSYYDS